MSKSDNSESSSPKPSGKRGGLHGLLTGLFVIFAILLVAGFFVVRTTGFRKWLLVNIEKQTGLVASIEKTRIGWPYGLVIEGFKSQSGETGDVPGIVVDEIRIDPGIGSKTLVTLTGCNLTLANAGDEQWEPAFFADLGDVREISQIAPLTERFRRNIRLKVIRGAVLWLDKAGNRIAAASDFDFNIEPVSLSNGRTVYYSYLFARELVKEGGDVRRNVRVEWFTTEDDKVIEINHEDKDGFPLPARKKQHGRGK